MRPLLHRQLVQQPQAAPLPAGKRHLGLRHSERQAPGASAALCGDRKVVATKYHSTKVVHPQNYFHGAILSNLDREENMRNAIWASLFHCTSTDEDPHHLLCSEGKESWCFFPRAEARGGPGPHAQHCSTATQTSCHYPHPHLPALLVLSVAEEDTSWEDQPALLVLRAAEENSSWEDPKHQ